MIITTVDCFEERRTGKEAPQLCSLTRSSKGYKENYKPDFVKSARPARCVSLHPDQFTTNHHPPLSPSLLSLSPAQSDVNIVRKDRNMEKLGGNGVELLDPLLLLHRQPVPSTQFDVKRT